MLKLKKIYKLKVTIHRAQFFRMSQITKEISYAVARNFQHIKFSSKIPPTKTPPSTSTLTTKHTHFLNPSSLLFSERVNPFLEDCHIAWIMKSPTQPSKRDDFVYFFFSKHNYVACQPRCEEY